MRKSLWILVLCLAFVGCDDEEGGDDTTAVEPEPVEPEEVGGEDTVAGDEADVAEETTAYTIHEWGLIDIDLGEHRVEYAAGPGRATTGSATTGTTGSTTGTSGTHRPHDPVDTAFDTANSVLDALGGGHGAAPRKPVLYFHLTDRNPDFTFGLTVNLGTGNVVEHFPAGTTADHAVTWSGVALSRDSCAGGPYPTSDSDLCTSVSDGYCEVAELAAYVASDAGCLTVGGTQHNFLFYRGDGVAPTIPLTIERRADGTITVRNDSMGEPVGQMLRLRRASGGAIQVAQVTIPGQGQSISVGLPADAAADTHRETVRTQLRAIGLTDPEAEAFERAWFGELFDGDAQTPHAFPDAVLFFLPSDAVDALAHLEPDPAPASMVRAMAVRAGWTSL